MSDPVNRILNVTRIEIAYRNKVKKKDRIPVPDPEAASVILRLAWDESKIELVEEVKVLLLDIGNSCLGVADIARGGITSCPVDLKILFATALLARASKFILAHNHPSGSLSASEADIKLTRDVMKAAAHLNMEVADHVIMTSDGHYSMKGNGQMPTISLY